MANVYILDGGSGDGSAWNNALDDLPATLVRGNTYYIGDGVYAAYSFDDVVSGTTLITIKKATVADHGTSTGWLDSYGDGVAAFSTIEFTTSYWVFDGQVGGGPSPTALGHGFSLFSSAAVLCSLTGVVSNITIRHVGISSDRGSTFIGGIKGTTGNVSNLTVEYCALTDIFGPPFFAGNWSNSTFQYNYIARNKNTPAFHSEGVSSFGMNTNLMWNANYWDAIEGTAVYAGVNFGTGLSWTVRNNIFLNSTTPMYFYWEDPGTNQYLLSGCSIYNNAVIGSSSTGQSVGGFAIQSGLNNIARNNLFSGAVANSFAWSSNTDHNYSWAYGNYRQDSGPFEKDSEIVAGESNGVIGTSSPFISASDYHLNSTTSAGISGQNLYSSFSTDIEGNIRPSSGPWTMGSYTYLQFVLRRLGRYPKLKGWSAV